MRTLEIICIAALLVDFTLPRPSAAAGNAFGPDQMRNLVGLSAPSTSPDGRQALVLVSRADWKNDTYVRDLDVYDLATHAKRTLTYERKGLSGAAWSPDGSRIAFLANAGESDDAKPQVFVMPLGGGDPRPITHAEDGVAQFAWRPDGSAIAYVAAEPKPKRTGANKYLDAFVFTTEPITTREPDRPAHLFVVSADGGTARRLTHGDESVASGEAQSTLSWSPDGKTLAFTITPNAILNDSVQGHVDLIDVASDKLDRLTSNDGFEGGGIFSPDGKHVAYQHSKGDSQIALNDAYVTTPGDGNGTDLTVAFDRQVHDLRWAADSRALYFTCADGARLRIVRAPLDGNAAAVDTGEINPTFFDATPAKDGSFTFVGTTTESPPELYRRSAAGTVERISDYNAPTRALSLAASETIEFPTTLGTNGDAVLLEPPGFTAGKMYPLALLVHGGPTSSSATTFDSFGQVLASHGWLVLEPNYRGSDNLGLRYQHAVLYDPDDGPGKDIDAAIKAIEARGIVDTHRIAVSGWSYGGIMTAWMISKYHYFRAAVSGASVNDWATDYGVADDAESDAALFHGSPYVRNGYQDEWKRASAVTYAPDVTTPVLILSDAGDNRDPFATSSMYYRALHDNHKDATLVQYPVDGHFPSDPIRRTDVVRRFGDYIAAHFH